MKPVLIKKILNKPNSRTSTKGFTPFHACPACSYQSQIKSRVVHHMTMCQKVPKEHNPLALQKSEDMVQKIPPQISIQGSDANCLAQLEDPPQIQQRIAALQKKVGDINDSMRSSKEQPNIYQLATQVYNMSADAIKGVLITKISEALSNSLQTSEEINTKKFQITSSLIGRFQEMDFSNLINSFQEKLQKYFFNVKKDHETRDLTRPVQLQYEKAYKFYSEFQEVDMVIQIPVIEKLMALGPYRKRFLIKFYTKMINDFPRMFPYDPLPKFLKKRQPTNRLHYQQVSFQLVRQITQELYITNPQLATDLWMVVSLGLRKHDTLRAFFYIPNTNTFAGYIRLIQKKNNHDCIRVIPSSLMRLITLTQTKYPITVQRYHAVKKFAIDKFGRFYCLRGVCLTTIFTAFFKADVLAQTHRSVNVPMRHYVNFQSRNLIDSAFSLIDLPQIEFSAAESLLLDLKTDKQQPIVINYQTKKLEIFGINKADIMNQLSEIEQQETGQAQNNLCINKIVPSEQTFEVFVQKIKSSIFVKFGKTASNQIFSTLQQALNSFQPRDSTMDESPFTFVDRQEPSSQEICLTFSKALRFQVCIIQATCSDQKLRFNQSNHGNGESSISVIKLTHEQFGTYYIPCEDSSDDKKCQIKKIETKKQENTELVLSLLHLTCPLCRMSRLACIPCVKNNHLAIYCESCQRLVHQCQAIGTQVTQFIPKAFVTIQPMAKDQISHYLRPLKRRNNKNNILQTVQSQGYQFLTDTIYISGISTSFLCQYHPLDLSTSKIILQNRQDQQFLPLQIKQSTILNAGLGVFSTMNIPKNTLLCSYLGQIGLGSNISYLRNGKKNDSLYFLGNIGLDSLNIAPCLFSNVGRYINHNLRRLCNCSPHIGLLQYEKNKYEVCVFLSSIREIKKGEEIFYFYGKQYQFDNELKKK